MIIYKYLYKILLSTEVALYMVMLDYGFRSKCCLAPIRLGRKKLPKVNQKISVWVCCTCGTKDVLIIPTEEALSQRAAKNKLDKINQKLDT